MTKAVGLFGICAALASFVLTPPSRAGEASLVKDVLKSILSKVVSVERGDLLLLVLESRSDTRAIDGHAKPQPLFADANPKFADSSANAVT